MNNIHARNIYSSDAINDFSPVPYIRLLLMQQYNYQPLSIQIYYLTHVTHSFSHYAALGVDNLSSSL